MGLKKLVAAVRRPLEMNILDVGAKANLSLVVPKPQVNRVFGVSINPIAQRVWKNGVLSIIRNS